jgi:hypothetical protein
VLVEAENKTFKTEFVSLDVFRWVKVAADIGGAETLEQVAPLVGAALEEAMGKQDGRPCCVRVILQGRCPIHGRLSTDPEALSANIRAVATDVSRGRAWVEKVELDTAPDFDIGSLARSDTPQGELLRYLDELASSSQLHQDLGVDLTQLKSKLSGNHVDVPEGNMDRMLVGARDILLTMLADMESKEQKS